MQDFGNAVSHPNSRFYAAFVQNAFQATRNLTLNFGLRYDLQTFEPGPLQSNPLYTINHVEAHGGIVQPL